MRSILRLFAVMMAFALPAAASAEDAGLSVSRLVQAHAAPVVQARYGPFLIVDGRTAALVGATDARSPAAFRAMLRDHPGLSVLEFRDCPGTVEDHANLELGRLIRAADLAVHVPEHGSVRSGAVELVFAGRELIIDDGAEFAVHAWMDNAGQGAGDYSADSPEHRKYLDYYREMGMSGTEAQAFYAMTNSVPFAQALWIDGAEMRRWVPAARQSPAADIGAEEVLPELVWVDLLPPLY